MDQNCSLRDKSLVPAEYLALLSVHGEFRSIGAFLIFDDFVSTYDLNIQESCTAKFIHYWYSFHWQVTKQNVKAPGPLVELH